MSADNGIYILQTSDGYRVAHLQAIENLFWANGEEQSLPQPNNMIDMFGECQIFKTSEEAYFEAERIYRKVMESDCPVIEYGICFLNYPQVTFPSEKVVTSETETWFNYNIKVEKEVKLVETEFESHYETIYFYATISFPGGRTTSFSATTEKELWEKINEDIYFRG